MHRKPWCNFLRDEEVFVAVGERINDNANVVAGTERRSMKLETYRER